LLALGVRIRYLGEALRVDEAYTYAAYASKPLSFGLTHYTGNNQLFHTLLVHGFVRALWNSPVVIRLPALIAGVSLVPATYVMARRLYSPGAALIAAALVATSSALIEYSVNARGYSIVALVLVLLLALAPTLLRTERPAPWWLYLGLVTIGFYTIPVMLFAFGTLVTWLAASGRLDLNGNRKRFYRRLIVSSAGAGALTLLLYTPVFATSGFRSVFANQYAAPVSFTAWLRGFPLMLGDIWDQWNRGLPWIVAVALAVGFAAALVAHQGAARHRVPLPAAAASWILPQLAIQRVLPFTRVWLFLIPLYFAVSAAGLVWLGERALRFKASAAIPAMSVALAAFLAVTVVSSHAVDDSHESGRLREAEQIVEFLGPYLHADDRVLAVTPAQHPLRYYFGLHGFASSVLDRPLRDTTRLIVVVDTWEYQTLATTFRGTVAATVGSGGSVSVRGFGPPFVLKRFPTAILYEFDRAAARAVLRSGAVTPTK